jgi:hypothetical protein
MGFSPTIQGIVVPAATKRSYSDHMQWSLPPGTSAAGTSAINAQGTESQSLLCSEGKLQRSVQDRSKRACVERRFLASPVDTSASQQPTSASCWKDERPTVTQMQACEELSLPCFDILKEIYCRHPNDYDPTLRMCLHATSSNGEVITAVCENLFDKWVAKLGHEIQTAETEKKFPGLFPECMVTLMVGGFKTSRLFSTSRFKQAQLAVRAYVGIRLGYEPQNPWSLSKSENNQQLYKEHEKTVCRFGTQFPVYAAIRERLRSAPGQQARIQKLLGTMVDFGANKDGNSPPEFGEAWPKFLKIFLDPVKGWDDEKKPKFTEDLITNVLPRTGKDGQAIPHQHQSVRRSQCGTVLQAVEDEVLGKEPQVHEALTVGDSPRVFELFMGKHAELMLIKSAFEAEGPNQADILNTLLVHLVEISGLIFPPQPPHKLPFQIGQQLEHFVNNLWDAQGKRGPAMLTVTTFAHKELHKFLGPSTLESEYKFAQNCIAVFNACEQFLVHPV